MNKKRQSINAKNGDFYINENGFMVFTESHHLKRGYCCGHGCLHCPYPKEKLVQQQKNDNFCN